MIEFEEQRTMPARIKVIGIGGGGCNAVDNMIRSNLEGVECIAANTDVQSLLATLAPTKVQMGAKITKGLGSGGNPEIGKSAALEDLQAIKEAISNTDMLFITAGMGGGTGTGGAPVVARVAREMDILTVAVVTKPFFFEGKLRQSQAEQGLVELEEAVDTLIAIPNDRLLSISAKETSLQDAFKLADDVLLQAVKGISDIITRRGLINVDFADVETVMSGMGMALMGTGEASGENRGVEAAQLAISSPLLDDISIEGATGVLINITGSAESLTLNQVKEAVTLIHKEAHEEANIIFGAVIDEEMGDNLKVTVIATGFRKGQMRPEADSLSSIAPAERDLISGDLEVPTWIRWKKRGLASSSESKAPRKERPMSVEDLEIPAFLRRQAD
jgi:cell division protein FtsZ